MTKGDRSRDLPLPEEVLDEMEEKNGNPHGTELFIDHDTITEKGKHQRPGGGSKHKAWKAGTTKKTPRRRGWLRWGKRGERGKKIRTLSGPEVFQDDGNDVPIVLPPSLGDGGTWETQRRLPRVGTPQSSTRPNMVATTETTRTMTMTSEDESHEMTSSPSSTLQLVDTVARPADLNIPAVLIEEPVDVRSDHPLPNSSSPTLEDFKAWLCQSRKRVAILSATVVSFTVTVALMGAFIGGTVYVETPSASLNISSIVPSIAPSPELSSLSPQPFMPTATAAMHDNSTGR